MTKTPAPPASRADGSFPGYVGQTDISLKEFEYAASVVQAEERLVSNTSAVLTFAAAAASSLSLGRLRSLFSTDMFAISNVWVFALVGLLIWTATYFVLVHLSAIRRNLVYSSRKLIVLRVMLGQKYGNSSLVLPNWRIEGADEPYAIKMFPGWRVRQLYPFYAVALASGIIFAALTYAMAQTLIGPLLIATQISHYNADNLLLVSLGAASLWVVACLLATRRQLMDDHERPLLLIVRLVAWVLRIRLTGKFEHILYTAKRGRAEMERMKVDRSMLARMAVFREDRQYEAHNGFSLRALARAARDRLVHKVNSGGSTIPQQLARTLFIVKPQNTARRKLVEILLALWLSSVLEKKDLLAIYLVSVRFDRNVDGVLAAMKHFFKGRLIENPTAAEAFVLIERVSSVTSSFRDGGVARSLRDAVSAKVMTVGDAREALAIYTDLIGRGLIAPGAGRRPDELAAAFAAPSSGQP